MDVSAVRTPLLERLKKPWLMADADKCVLIAAIVGSVTALYTGFEYLGLLYPHAAPYLHLPFVRALIPWHVVLVAAWIAVLLLSLALRRRPARGRLVVHMLSQVYAIGFALTSYCYGHFTTNYLSAVIFGGLTVGFLLFDRKPVLLALASATLIVVGTTIAEQAGWIPSAPLLASSPIIGRQLAASWLWSIGALVLFAQLIATGITFHFFNRMRQWEAELAQARDLISRYVPQQVADEIAAGRGGATRHERRKLTVFFSDLVGFTEIAEDLDPEDLSRLLNEYFTEMTAIADRHGGTVDELAGDAILVFFGAPQATDDRDHALRAVRMAIDMQAATAALNERWQRAGIPQRFRLRMGIDTGVVTVGNFGSAGRMKYAVLGRHVNLAARLQAHCAPDRILLSYNTWLLVHEQIPCTARGEVQLKGVTRPVQVYEVDLPAEQLSVTRVAGRVSEA